MSFGEKEHIKSPVLGQSEHTHTHTHSRSHTRTHTWSLWVKKKMSKNKEVEEVFIVNPKVRHSEQI